MSIKKFVVNQCNQLVANRVYACINQPKNGMDRREIARALNAAKATKQSGLGLVALASQNKGQA